MFGFILFCFWYIISFYIWFLFVCFLFGFVVEMKSIVLSISPQSGRAAYVPVVLFNMWHLCLLLHLISESWRLIRFSTHLVCKPSTKVMYLYPNYRFFFNFHILSAIIITAIIGSCKKLKNSNLFHISALARICRQRKTVTNLFVSLEP